MFLKIRRVIVAIILLATVHSHAAILFNPSFSYLHSKGKDDNDGEDVTMTTTPLDIKISYLFPEGYFVGGIYAIVQGSGTSSGSGVSLSETRYGATAGYWNGTLLVGFSLFLMGEKTYTVGGTTEKFSGGSGMMFDLGYYFMFGTYGFGPQLNYIQMNYARKSTNGVEGTRSASYTEIQPKIGFMATF